MNHREFGLFRAACRIKAARDILAGVHELDLLLRPERPIKLRDWINEMDEHIERLTKELRIASEMPPL